jgi:hypothetical protein
MSLTVQQKKDRAKKMQAGRIAKQKARAEEETHKNRLINQQAAKIKELQAGISEKNVGLTSGYIKTGQSDEDIQGELDKLRKELVAMQTVLSESGALPKKVASHPWRSTERPFHKDIFRTKKQHKGFKLGFVSEEELDDYESRGYTKAKGEDYGEKPGILKRRKMIGVEQPIEADEEKRRILRDFNRAQRTSALQKVEDMSNDIARKSGRKTEYEFGYEVHK